MMAVSLRWRYSSMLTAWPSRSSSFLLAKYSSKSDVQFAFLTEMVKRRRNVFSGPSSQEPPSAYITVRHMDLQKDCKYLVYLQEVLLMTTYWSNGYSPNICKKRRTLCSKLNRHILFSSSWMTSLCALQRMKEILKCFSGKMKKRTIC